MMQAEEIVQVERLTPDAMGAEGGDSNEDLPESAMLMHETLQSSDHGCQEYVETLRNWIRTASAVAGATCDGA